VHVFIAVAGNQISFKQFDQRTGLKPDLFRKLPLNALFDRLRPLVHGAGGDFEKHLLNSRTILPDEEELPLRGHRNSRNDRLVSNPALVGDPPVRQQNLSFVDLKNAARVDPVFFQSFRLDIRHSFPSPLSILL
jgi:hypothetical protein